MVFSVVRAGSSSFVGAPLRNCETLLHGLHDPLSFPVYFQLPRAFVASSATENALRQLFFSTEEHDAGAQSIPIDNIKTSYLIHMSISTRI